MINPTISTDPSSRNGVFIHNDKGNGEHTDMHATNSPSIISSKRLVIYIYIYIGHAWSYKQPLDHFKIKVKNKYLENKSNEAYEARSATNVGSQ
jgi:hypothetical protein